LPLEVQAAVEQWMQWDEDESTRAEVMDLVQKGVKVFLLVYRCPSDSKKRKKKRKNVIVIYPTGIIVDVSVKRCLKNVSNLISGFRIIGWAPVYVVRSISLYDIIRLAPLKRAPTAQVGQKGLLSSSSSSTLCAGASDELRGRMCERLTFGTAGLRGLMGAGFNRMNALTVVQVDTPLDPLWTPLLTPSGPPAGDAGPLYPPLSHHPPLRR
jgi:hypothetical protein